MTEIVVADAGPIIALARIEQLSLLPQIFSRTILPLSVYSETQRRPELADARVISAAREAALFDVHELPINVISGLPEELGVGEVEAISLAAKIHCGVFMDEKAGRVVAKGLGLKTIGTLGVLSLAHRQGRVAKLKPLIEGLQQSGYYFSTDLVETVLRAHGELP